MSTIPDTGNTAEVTCTDTTYAANTGTGLINLPATVTTDAGACNASGNGTGALVSETENFYDGQGLGVAPTAGNLTKTEKATATATFDTSTSTYDQYGRVLTVTDPDGNTTTTAYTPATGAEPTRPRPPTRLGLVTTTHLSTRPANCTLTVTEPDGGRDHRRPTTPSAARPPNGLPGNPTTGPATTTCSYTTSTTAPPVTTEQALEPDGNYLTIETIDDSFGNIREIQRGAAGGGADVTDTTYNSDGWKPFSAPGPTSSRRTRRALWSRPPPAASPTRPGTSTTATAASLGRSPTTTGTETWETDTHLRRQLHHRDPARRRHQLDHVDRRTRADHRDLPVPRRRAGQPVGPRQRTTTRPATPTPRPRTSPPSPTPPGTPGPTATTCSATSTPQTDPRRRARPPPATTTPASMVSVTDARGKTGLVHLRHRRPQGGRVRHHGRRAENHADSSPRGPRTPWPRASSPRPPRSRAARPTPSRSPATTRTELPSGDQTTIPSAQGALAGTYSPYVYLRAHRRADLLHRLRRRRPARRDGHYRLRRHRRAELADRRQHLRRLAVLQQPGPAAAVHDGHRGRARRTSPTPTTRKPAA